MSTILQALRRAESERQRGSVPTLHGPAQVLAGVLPEPPLKRAPRWPWALTLVLPVLIALALAMMIGEWWRAPREGVGVAGAPVVASVPARVPATASTPVSAAAPASSTTASPPPVEAKEHATPSPATKALPAHTPAKVAPKRAAPAPSVPAAVAKAKSQPVPAQASAEGPVFALADLPAAVRAELPRLHLAGITWSANARLRMAIVNGQVLHEGESAAPGLVLAHIEPARTIWAFRGYHIAIASQ